MFAVSNDGARIAYDAVGTGPAVILLHGAGQSRRVWHDHGYVERLWGQFHVISIDIRGNGESDKPTDAEAYSIDRLTADVLSVADAAGVSRFSVWGYSYGGNIGRYLPGRSDRVGKLAIMGIGFGASAPEPFRAYALGLRSKWTPIIEAGRSGTLNLGDLTEQDRALWQSGVVPRTIAQLSAIVAWPPVEPADLGCPTLWLVGGANDNAMSSVSAYRDRLFGTKVSLQVLPGLTHEDELTKIDEIVPALVAFEMGTNV